MSHPSHDESDPPRERLGPGWSERIAPCVHEAGHAVIADVLGGVVAFVQVARGDGSGESNIRIEDPRNEAIGRLAGSAAERRYNDLVGGCPPDRHPELSDHDDRDRALAAAQRACPGDLLAASDLLAESRTKAEVMVQAEWDRIRARRASSLQ